LRHLALLTKHLQSHRGPSYRCYCYLSVTDRRGGAARVGGRDAAGHVQERQRGAGARATAWSSGDAAGAILAGTRQNPDTAGRARIQIRRSSAARPEASRSTLEAVDGNDIDALRREVKRLRGQVARLEEDKQELERRIGFMQRQVEELRAKIPRGISTS